MIRWDSYSVNRKDVVMRFASLAPSSYRDDLSPMNTQIGSFVCRLRSRKPGFGPLPGITRRDIFFYSNLSLFVAMRPSFWTYMEPKFITILS